MINCLLPLGPKGNTVANCYKVLADYIAAFNISPYNVELSVSDEHFLGSDEECEAAQESVGYYNDPRVVSEYGFMIELTELDAERLIHRGRREGRHYFQMLTKDRGILLLDNPGVTTPGDNVNEWKPMFEAFKYGKTTASEVIA